MTHSDTPTSTFWLKTAAGTAHAHWRACQILHNTLQRRTSWWLQSRRICVSKRSKVVRHSGCSYSARRWAVPGAQLESKEVGCESSIRLSSALSSPTTTAGNSRWVCGLRWAERERAHLRFGGRPTVLRLEMTVVLQVVGVLRRAAKRVVGHAVLGADYSRECDESPAA